MMYRTSIFFVLFSVLFFSAWAQPYPSQGNRFELDKIKGCAPLDINIGIILPSLCDGGANPCVVNFGEGAGFVPFQTSYTYNNPGVFTLAIIFGASGSDQITIEVLPDIQPAFEIYGCDGLNSVAVNITDTNYDEYLISYSDGASVTVPVALPTDTHDFGSPGLKSISVQGRKLGYENNCTPFQQDITVTAALTDGQITQLIANPNQIQLDFNNAQFTLYKLERATNNATTFLPLQDIYNMNSVIINSVSPDINYYCFRLGTFDPCSGNIIGYSDVICSADFEASAKSGFNELSWKTSAMGISDYSISKADNTTTHMPLPAASTDILLNDPAIICGLTYSYQLTSNYTNGSRSISLIAEATAFSTAVPTPIENITSVVSQNSVTLEWQNVPGFIPSEYSVYKSANTMTLLFGKTATETITDAEYDTRTSTCYQISYTDICGGESIVGPEACPIQLTGKNYEKNNIVLNWNEYTGWKDGVASYTVKKFDSQGVLVKTFSSITTSTLDYFDDDTLNQVHTYIVEAVPIGPGLNISVSNIATIIKEPYLHYPNAFTPNGDQFNDTFHIRGKYIAAIDMKIFNRWGEMLYSTDNRMGWDGTSRGKQMPEGTYVFSARITDMAGRTFERKGAFLLFKKN